MLFAVVSLDAPHPVRPPERTFPFTAEEDVDGARYVWFMYQEAGLPYAYVPARSLPTLPSFVPSPGNSPRAGDVAWWREFVALSDPKPPTEYGAPAGCQLVTARGVVCLRDLERKYGPVEWLRLKAK